MKHIDKYILNNFLVKFFLTIGCLLVITILIDVIDHLNKFIDAKIPQSEIINYYYYSLPWFISIGIPISCLISTIFSLGLLQRQNEITAMKSSGLSIFRISSILLIIGIFISISSFYFDNYLVTNALNIRNEIDNKYFRSRDSLSFMGINLLDITTGEILLENFPIPDQFGFDMPVTHGFKLHVDGIANGLHGIFMVHDGETPHPEYADYGYAEAHATGGRAIASVMQEHQWLNYPAYEYAANSNGGYYFATQGGGIAASETSYYEQVFRGNNWETAGNNDFEMRFTAGGGKCWLAYTSGAVIDVPFELWNVGISTPDDPSDDYRMTCWIYDYNGSGTYDWHGELEDSGALNDPGTDWVYWRNPVDMAPGTAGYDATVAAADYGYPDLAGTEVMARTIWNNWNGYGSKVDSVAVSDLSNPDPASWTAADTTLFNNKGFFINTANSVNNLAGVFTDNATSTLAAAGTAVSGYVYANVMLFPAEGSVYRWITNKPNATTDTFTFSTSDATPTSMAYSCDEIYVWPNPYFGYNPEERTAVDNQIHFGGLSTTATIRIYDLGGNLVRKLTHSSGNTEIWDVKNSFNVLVASGMYIVNIEADGCGKMLKVAVIAPEQRIDVY